MSPNPPLEGRFRFDVEPSRTLGPWDPDLRAGVHDAVLRLMGAQNASAEMSTALQALARGMKAHRVLLFEAGGSYAGPVELLFGWSEPDAAPPLGIGAVKAVIDAGAAPDEVWTTLRAGRATAVSERTTANGLKTFLDSIGARSLLLAPILASGRCWGQVAVADAKRVRAWTQGEFDALQIFAELAGAAILRDRRLADSASAERAQALPIYHDPLTGLASRKLFLERLERAMAESQPEGEGFAVHYVDLDHFKDVNETMGHPVGDQLLQAVADRLRHVTRGTDVVARFGGDEFGVLELGIRRPEDAASLARKVVDALKEPFSIGGRELHIGGSIGVAVHEPGALSDPEAMLSHAEIALYRAKADGRRTYRFFTEAMDAEARRRVLLADELRKGLAIGEFFMVYQPQVDMASSRITGVEALVRWRHPTRGIVPPEAFIRAAEANGMIVPLGDWILEEVCRQARAWLDDGLAPPSVSVNVSAIQFLRPMQLQETIAEIVRETRLPRGLLQIELTETALMEASIAKADVLDAFHRQGLKISLDDFGTGYSSLNYLHRYRVDQIKIAQEFVGGMVETPGDAAIVKAAIGLARALDLRIVAEGVERADQAKLLSDWGCQEVQGFYYSPPVSAEAFAALLRAGVLAPSPAPVEA